jgi:heme exporter protein A
VTDRAKPARGKRRRPASSADLRLVADRLACERVGRRLFEALSFQLAAGEALLLTGPNGSGKTSLLRLIAGFLPPAAGVIELEGERERSLGELCHYVGHLNAIKTALTVRENLAFWADYLAGDRRHLAEAISGMGLAPLAEIPAGLLSAGQKRRLALARLRVAHRPLWLLDEPSVSLDSDGADLLRDLVEHHLAQGGLAVIATHTALHLRHASEIRLGKARLQ